LNVQFYETDQLIKVTITGTPTYEDISQLVREAFDIASQHKCNHFIFDFSQAKVYPTASAPYAHLDNPDSPKPVPSRKSAIIYSDNESFFEFIEIIFNSRGYQVESFQSEELAIKWLKSS